MATLATAMMRYENQDSVIKQVRRLGDLLYPEDPAKKQEREQELKDVLRREGVKSYKVMQINLGERRE